MSLTKTRRSTWTGTRLRLTGQLCCPREQDPDGGRETVTAMPAAGLAAHGLRHSQKDAAAGADRAGSGRGDVHIERGLDSGEGEKSPLAADICCSSVSEKVSHEREAILVTNSVCHGDPSVQPSFLGRKASKPADPRGKQSVPALGVE